MKIVKGFLKVILTLIIILCIILGATFIYHKICNKIYEDKYYEVPGDLIEVYDNEFMHTKKLGEGKYTIVMLSGMGTPSPYYDYYKLAESLSEKNSVIIVEQLGYGYSSDTEKERTLENYSFEINKVLDYYQVKDNIVLLAHSYMGPITLNYSNNNTNVVGYVCLDCSSAYQVEKEVSTNEPYPTYPNYYTLMSPLGITRLIGLIGGDELLDELYLSDIKSEHREAYKYLIYNKTLNKTILNEMTDFPRIEKEMLYKKYRSDLNVITYLSSDTIESMDEYLKEEDFFHGWEEMHSLAISNEEKQKIYTLKGDHYIHHGNTIEITNGINDMLSQIN